jgi:hypothetical protein
VVLWWKIWQEKRKDLTLSSVEVQAFSRIGCLLLFITNEKSRSFDKLATVLKGEEHSSLSSSKEPAIKFI